MRAMAGESRTIACVVCGTREAYPLWCQKPPELHEVHATVHRCRACASRKGRVGAARPAG